MGRTSATVVPSRGVLVALTEPPWAAAMSATIASPSPLPVESGPRDEAFERAREDLRRDPRAVVVDGDDGGARRALDPDLDRPPGAP